MMLCEIITISNHSVQQLVDLVLPISVVSALDKVIGLLGESSERVAQFERPQEVGHLLEVWSDCPDLVDDVLNADDVVLAQVFLNDVIVGDGNTLALLFGESTFVNELSNGLLAGVAPREPRVGNAEHLNGGLVQLNENSVVDLTESQKLEDFAWARVDLVDTTDTHNEC